MKKKIALFLMFIISSLSILTGCNLFSTNNYNALSSIVATNGDVSITRQDLISAYNNGGYYYNYLYGYTQEEALRMTIDELIDQEYLLKYIDSQGSKYSLSSDDYCIVISDTWEYIDNRMSTYVEAVRNDLGLSKEELSTEEEAEEPEYAPQEQYVTKFENIDGKIVLIESQEEDEILVHGTFTSEEEARKYATSHAEQHVRNHISAKDKDYVELVWTRYITALKSEQANYNYKDMSDEAVFNREITEIFNSNLRAQKITKYQEITELSNGFYYDDSLKRYVIQESTLQKIVDTYVNIYNENVEKYNSTKNKTNYYTSVAGTDSRENYVYYGNQSEETLITCTHILIQLSEGQLNEIDRLESSSMYQGEVLEEMLKNEKSQENTLAFERDLETGEVIDTNGISVATLYQNLKDSLKTVNGIENITKVFNNYLYRYNVDSGIINAHYDYVVGTKNSAMVDSFTNLVRDLYENGKVGDVGICYEENDSYSGYHIVLYTGTLTNLFETTDELKTLTTENVYKILSSEKTSISYNQTIFELMFDNTIQDIYDTQRTNAVASQMSGTTTVYEVANFSDLY